MTDKELRDRMEATLNASTDEVAKQMVATHARNGRDLDIVMGICMNPGQRPWENDEGVKLIELCRGLPDEEHATFDYTEFGPQSGWPRLKVMLVSPGTLSFDLKHGDRFFHTVMEALKNGSAKCVFPEKSGTDAMGYLNSLLKPSEAA
jgi:hypothetical protein